MSRTHPFAMISLALALASSGLYAQDKKPEFKVPADVTLRTADIMSEGTRMAAEVFAPKSPKSDKLPTIVMSHGWGGTAAGLRPDGIAFSQAGYLVVAFDYRATGVKKLVTVKGIKHYGVYNEARGQAQQEAIAWFDEYLKK